MRDGRAVRREAHNLKAQVQFLVPQQNNKNRPDDHRDGFLRV